MGIENSLSYIVPICVFAIPTIFSIIIGIVAFRKRAQYGMQHFLSAYHIENGILYIHGVFNKKIALKNIDYITINNATGGLTFDYRYYLRIIQKNGGTAGLILSSYTQQRVDCVLEHFIMQMEEERVMCERIY